MNPVNSLKSISGLQTPRVRLNRRLATLLVISVLFLLFILTILIFSLVRLSNNKSDLVSYPIYEESPEQKDISFSLNSSPLNPENGNNINFSSVWDGEYILTENTSSILVTSDNIEMYVFIGSGETEGLYNKVSQLGVLSNPNFNNPIMKVATDRLNITYSNSVSSELKEFVFYSDQFKFINDCNVFGTSYDGCGTQEIKGAKDLEGISVGVFCAAATQDDFSTCDRFLENLTLTGNMDNAEFKDSISNCVMLSYPVNSGLCKLKTYTDDESVISYSYPADWAFRNGREGIGLYPVNDPNYSDGETEILTIFAEESTLSPKEWSVNYDGSGYSVEEERQIGEYDGYYVENRSDNYYTILYTLSNRHKIVHVVFRKWLTTNDSYLDNSKYSAVVESIVNSIRIK